MTEAGGLALDVTAASPDRLPVLVLTSGGGDPIEERILAGLSRHRSLDLRRGSSISELGGHEAVLALGAGAPLSAEEHRVVEGYVRHGGTLVALGRACDIWAATELAGELVPPASRQLAPPTELRLRPSPSWLTSRLDPEFMVRDRLRLDQAPPPGATVLLTADWHHRRRPVCWLRPAGRGSVAYLGLEQLDSGGDGNVARVLHRCLRHSVLSGDRPDLGAGLIGYGAIAAEHAAATRAVDGLALRSVCDVAEPRRRQAETELGVPSHESAEALLGDDDVDIVVVGTPPDTHVDLCVRSLAAGKHVVCEKPLALDTAGADRMIAAARASRRTLTTYQNRRWDPDFRALRRAVASGAVGEPFYLEMFVGGYAHPCPYWHSHAPVSGGTLFDWGAHFLDWILQLWDAPVASVRASAHKRVWLDVSNEDQVRMDLTFADGREALFLHSDVAAALKPKWYLLGTAGAIVGDWRREVIRERGPAGTVLEDHLAPADTGASLRLLRPDGSGSTSEETLTLPPARPHAFYRNLADHILLDEDLDAPPEQGRRVVSLMQAAMESIARGGAPVRPDS